VLLLVYKINEKKIFYAPFEAGASQFKCLLEKLNINRKQIRDQLGIKKEVVFLFVGTLHPFKGVSDLIEAASRLPKESKFTCVFAGREEPRNKYRGTIKFYDEIASELGIKNRILFLGELSIENLASIYLASDVVVLPTRKDCFPKVLVEGALASKALITTTACGSAGELVIDGKNGLIIEPGDIESLAEAMKQLLNFNLRDKMGNCSKDIVEKVCKKEAETEGFVRSIYEAIKMQRGQIIRDEEFGYFKTKI
jgi:glycosyltransferase involved in cell wall biosynthesis